MSGRNFREMLEKQWDRDRFLCVGLDSDYELIPEKIKRRCFVTGRADQIGAAIFDFNREIINKTWDLVCAFKPNIAFYEAWGPEGIDALIRTIKWIKLKTSDVPIILDAKRADIGNTNNGYVRMAFEILGVDAITVSPYLGSETMKPFLERKDKGIFVLCRTSNPGAGEFQSWDITGDVVPGGYMPLYKYVAYQVAREWNKSGNCGLVVGATAPAELSEVREVVGDMPILIPGIGAQGGDLEATVKAGKDSRGKGIIINASRSIIFASREADFAEAAMESAKLLHDEINQYR